MPVTTAIHLSAACASHRKQRTIHKAGAAAVVNRGIIRNGYLPDAYPASNS